MSLEFSYLVLTFVILLISLSFHEFCHAFAAILMGDPTAKRMGRLSLNPVDHIDLIGTILLPLTSLISGSPILFGWAKPVPINPLNFREPRRDSAIVSFAGPASNFLLAIIFGMILKYVNLPESIWRTLIISAVYTNLALGVFNLLPVPPLDGSKILEYFLPYEMAWKLEQIQSYGLLLLLFILISPIHNLLNMIILFLYSLIT